MLFYFNLFDIIADDFFRWGQTALMWGARLFARPYQQMVRGYFNPYNFNNSDALSQSTLLSKE